ncbi:hypothetical protein [Pinibacter aurantiacus]|uniref:Uncharacterized protein n=1 Tax=Pinibacter aurantiacus TaxID=2851599 RepID=A0A9E2SDM7_9BACT|nr:hypothetical protein [Pinibacter aurantiacus]MBV4359413.1 hypothetical protein [Pinibacter aurantiacus]
MQKSHAPVKPAKKKSIKAKGRHQPKPAKKTATKSTPSSGPTTENGHPETSSWVGKIPHIEQGVYSDGLPYPDFNYLAFKLILKPNRFISRDSLFDFAKVIKAPAAEHGVSYNIHNYIDAPTKIREIIFIDTDDFRLYNNSFILRRRITYVNGFPEGDPEIVFKFRNADLQKTAETDVRPQIQGDYTVKFKCQVLPLKEKLGGVRILYSNNVQFPRKNVTQSDVLSFDVISEVFPALQSLKQKEGERINLVNNAIVEEVLQDICLLDFGDGLTAKANVGIWRTRGEHRPLIGEFAYQIKFKDRRELTREAMQRAEAFFLALQYSAKDWMALNATKTGIVYRLLGNPPKSNE